MGGGKWWKYARGWVEAAAIVCLFQWKCVMGGVYMRINSSCIFE